MAQTLLLYSCFYLRKGERILDILDSIIPYSSGFWTLPWIVVGFIVTTILSKKYGEIRINYLMKRIGLVLLFVFIPILLFKLFLNIDFREEEFDFIILTCAIIAALYVLAYLFAVRKAAHLNISKDETIYFVKTVIVNQGRSAAFFGSAVLAIKDLEIFAAIYLTLLGIFLFSIVPTVLSFFHHREIKNPEDVKKNPLPSHLRIYPWYLLAFPVIAALSHAHWGITTASYDWGTVLNFLGAITIPAALYYVGSGIKLDDIKIPEIKKLFFGRENNETMWTRYIVVLTMIITPLFVGIIFGILYMVGVIPATWVAVLFFNAILPITSTNMFLVPYGINKKVTALSVTWTTFFSIPIFLALLSIFSLFFS